MQMPSPLESHARHATPWTLRPYQTASLAAIEKAWGTRDRTLLVMATGLGKTTIFAETLRARRHLGRALVLAHRKELIDQAAERLRQAGLTVEIERGSERASTYGTLLEQSDVVVATVQTLRGERLKRWPASSFATIVVDEAHHVVAAGYRAILDHFERAKILGVTATPDRGDKIGVSNVIDHCAFTYGIREGIDDGWLARLRCLAIDTSEIDLSRLRVTKQEHGRDYSPEDLARIMETDAKLHEVAGPLAKEVGNRSTLVFVPSVDVAYALAEVLAGYLGAKRVAALDGESHKDERAAQLARFQSGDLQVLVNCALFTEGFDAPRTSCIAIARPTQSRSLYAQMVGRGLRLFEGKEDCLLLDFAPRNLRHSLVSPLSLMGKPLPEDIEAEALKRAQSGEDVRTVLRESEQQAADRAAKAQRDRDRDRAQLRIEVDYTARLRDAFEADVDLLDLEMTEADENGPRLTEPQRAALERALGHDPGNISRRQASAIFDGLTRRRSRNLCTLKQARVLAKRGLNPDLTFEAARAAMDALAANRWRLTPDMVERWGKPVVEVVEEECPF
jgi:superfamily II DNA or RNA helicase